MTDIYWPVYKNLETEVIKLTYDIHIDDDQLNVYSSKICDLILRSAIEIESISKELYYRVGGEKKQPKYDEEAIKLLNKKWNLQEKVAIISSPNCFQTNKILTPFEKDAKRKNSTLTYSWNAAYQELKHNRGENLNSGNIKSLFNILSALYILNLYYKDQVFTYLNPINLSNFETNLGSDIFSIKLHKWSRYSNNYNDYYKKEDFHESVYLTKYTEETIKNNIESDKRMMENQIILISNHPEYKYYKRKNPEKENLSLDYIMTEILSDEARRSIKIESYKSEMKNQKDSIEAVTNKNSI